MFDWVDMAAVWSILGRVSQIILTAGLSAFLTIYIVNRGKTRTDHADKRIDEVVADIRAVTDMASSFWLADAGPPELAVMETRISTRVRQIEEIRVLAAAAAPELLSDEVTIAASRFGRALTGGDFGVHNRKASLEAAKNCQHVANRYIGALRRARSGAI